MPVPAHVRIAFVGTLPGGEVFSSSFCAVPNGEPVSQAVLQDLVDAVQGEAAIGATAAALRKLLSTISSYRKVIGYYYGAGQTAATYYAETDFVAAGTGTEMHPNQCAIVSTLLTPFPGRRSRGRIYWPATGIPLGTDAQVPDADVANTATAVANVLQALPGSWAAAVISRVGQAASEINRVRVDSRLDVQRRRANRQAATHTESATVT